MSASEPILWGTPPTIAGGFPSRDALLERYAQQTGFDVSQIHFYRSFAMWRMAAILEGVRIRYVRGAYGKAKGIDLQMFADNVIGLAEGALELIEKM